MLKNVRLFSIILRPSDLQSKLQAKRCYGTVKRFYKSTNVIYNDGMYEITLDHRKLKTPNGSLLKVKSEPLAIAVATEWDSQKKIINKSRMHLTALTCTVIDNPTKLKKADLVNHILDYISTDTVLFQSSEEKNLFELQKNEWDPIIKWFNERYETNLEKILDIQSPQLSPGDKMKISRYLLSHDVDSLHGFVFAVDTLKSVVLAFATVESFLDVDKAVHLSRLEEEYQIGFWGRVEWSHDLAQKDLQARLAAAVLFIHFNRSEYFRKEKLVVK